MLYTEHYSTTALQHYSTTALLYPAHAPRTTARALLATTWTEQWLFTLPHRCMVSSTSLDQGYDAFRLVTSPKYWEHTYWLASHYRL